MPDFTESFEAGPLGGAITTANTITDPSASWQFSDTHVHTGVLAAWAPFGGDMSVAYADSAPMPSASWWTYFTGSTEGYVQVPFAQVSGLLGADLGHISISIHDLGDSDPRMYRLVTGVFTDTGVDYPKDQWVEWVWNGTILTVRPGGGDPILTLDGGGLVADGFTQFAPEGKVWVDDITVVFDLGIPTGVGALEARRLFFPT